MVTVIATKEELTTPGNNGAAGSSDNERPFQFIKDFQEVDLHRTASSKPLPEDLFGTIDGQLPKSSIKGTFFVQIDAIEPFIQISNNQNDNERSSSLLLTLTDGITTIKAITNDNIPHLNLNTRIGSKLLLTDVIPIKNDLFQLTYDNTRFHYGSSTYPRPRSANRGRGSGSYRPSYEGRRNSRYDNDDGETNFLKRPPPKNTLMDFMTSLKLSDDNDNKNEKLKERTENTKRRYNNNEQYYPPITANNSHYSSNNNSSNVYNDQIVFQPEGTNEQLDSEDDPSQANYRERRNPLPPRLQRAQEERVRRNTNRYYDETTSVSGNDINSIYHNGTTSNPSLSSSSSSYLRHGDQTSYIPNYPSAGQQHTTPLNSYVQHPNMLAAVNGSTSSHLAYYPTNPGNLTYSHTGIPNLPYGPSYTNEHLTYIYGAPYATSAYLPPTVFNGDSKNNGNIVPATASVDDNETTAAITELPNDENNDSGNKSESSPSEQKQSSPSSNDNSTNSQQVTNEHPEEKRQNSNPKPRWRLGDICLARWSEDGEFYYATVVQIQPPFCIVVFRDYNNYDQVHFNDLKMLPRDQQFYQFVPPAMVPSSELNALAASVYFPPRSGYYPSTIDGCLMMPEAPPFPFNSAGTLYMCQPPVPTTIPRSNRSNTNGYQQQQTRRNENGDSTLNSSSPPSKDSNDTSAIDSTTTTSSLNDENQQQDFALSSTVPRTCSIADAPLTLVTSDDLRERSTSTESLTSSKHDDEQKSTKDEEEIRE